MVTCSVVVCLCIFFTSLSYVKMQNANLALQGSVKPVALLSPQGLNNLSAQDNITAELTNLFASTTTKNNVTGGSSTEIDAELPMMEGGGKPIENKALKYAQSTTASSEVTGVPKKVTDQSAKIVTSRPTTETSSKGVDQGKIANESSKLPPITATNLSAEYMPSKIHPRKGVPLDPELMVHSPVTGTNSDFVKETFTENIVSSTSRQINNVMKSSNDSSKITRLESIDNKNPSSNSSVITQPLSRNNSSSNDDTIISNPPLKRKKPLITKDPSTDDIEASVMKSRKPSQQRDYVIPVVVTILTVPMLVVLGLYFYKKGHECWERRHYRRMDFLIDGMYND